MTEIIVREISDLQLSLEVDGKSVMERSFDDMEDMVAEAKRLFETTDATMIGIKAGGDIALHIGLTLMEAGVVVPDPWDENLPFDPDEPLTVPTPDPNLITGEASDLPDEIDGAAVIGVTFEMGFVVGDPIEDEETHFGTGADALLYAQEVVAGHQAEGRKVVLVVSPLAQVAMDADRQRKN